MKKITFCLSLFFLALSPSHTSQSEAEEMEELTRTKLDSLSEEGTEETKGLTQMELDSLSEVGETEEPTRTKLNSLVLLTILTMGVTMAYMLLLIYPFSLTKQIKSKLQNQNFSRMRLYIVFVVVSEIALFFLLVYWGISKIWMGEQLLIEFLDEKINTKFYDMKR